MKPISIIIPTYNRAYVLNTTIPKYSEADVEEIIVVDDGSTDETKNVVEKYCLFDKRIKYFSNKDNRGSPFSRNRGVDLASSDWIFFGEDDAYPAPGAISELYECLISSNLQIGGPRLVYLGNGESEMEAIKKGSHETPVDFDKERFYFNTSWTGKVDVLHALMMVNKSVFKYIKYDEKYRGNAYREETDFCLEARKREYEIEFFPSSVMFHLPRLKTGGQWNGKRFKYEIDILVNNFYFYKKHYQYMRQAGITKKSALALQFILLNNRIKTIIREILVCMGLK